MVALLALREGTYPPAPFLQGKGERMAFWRFVSLAVLMALKEWITP